MSLDSWEIYRRTPLCRRISKNLGKMVFRGMSAVELNAMVDDLIHKRKDVIVNVPKTLKTLAIITVLKTYHQISADGSYIIKPPLKNLPNSIVQDFLQIMKLANESNDELFEDDAIKLDFMKGLMNRQIREVNLNEFKTWCEDEWISLADLKDCINIRAFTLWEDYPVVQNHIIQLLPIDHLGNWRNLEVLSMRGYLCNDEVMKKIQFHFPNLKVLEVMVCFHSFTMRSVDHMTKLKKLKSLYIKACFGQPGDGDVTDIIAHAAGRISQLEKIQFDGAICPKDFIETYVRFYPKKNLTIVDLTIFWRQSSFEVKTSSGKFRVDDTTFEDGWPSNVAFEELTFIGLFPKAVLTIFKKQSMAVEKIKFRFTPVSVIYTLLEEFGSTITRLEITRIIEWEKLNLVRVLAACPILEDLSFSHGFLLDDFDQLLEAGLTPLRFKNLRSFHYNDYLQQTTIADYGNIGKILKLFLLGSENYSRKLTIFYWQFRTILEALEEDPYCLNRLEELVIIPGIKISDDQMAEILPLVYKICKKLLLRSPYLRKICFKNLDVKALRVTREIKHALFHSVARKINLQVVYDIGRDIFCHFISTTSKFSNDLDTFLFICQKRCDV